MAKLHRRLGDNVERIVILKRTRGGNREILEVQDTAPRYVFDDEDVRARIIHRDMPGVLHVDGIFKKRRKRQSWLLRPFEKRVRRGMARNIRVVRRYLELHDRSNRKKKNGWMRDYFRNMIKAQRRADD